jgi:hypothetical protein
LAIPTPDGKGQVSAVILDDLAQKEAADQKRLERGEKRDRALFLLHAFQFNVMGKVELWTTSARNISSAYVRAAKNHRDALAKVTNIKALEAQLLFSAITMVTSGLFSLVWSARGLNAATDLLTPVLKDTVMAGFGEEFSAIGPPKAALPKPASAAPTTDDDAVNKEPQEFHDFVMKKIDRWKANTQFLFARQWQDLQKMDESAWDKWDEGSQQDAYDGWWQEASKWWGFKVGDSEAEDEKQIADLAYDMERGMWAVWMRRLINLEWKEDPLQDHPRVDADDQHRFERQVVDYEGVRGPIAERFTELNILKEAGTTIEWYHSAKSEDIKLLHWAIQFKSNPPSWKALVS